MSAQNKIMDVKEAIDLIKSGDCVAINGFGSLCFPETVAIALGQKFLEEGQPRDLSYYFGAGLGESQEGRLIDAISHEGMVRRVVASHFIKMLGLKKLAAENKIEAYNLPYGPISHTFRAAAANQPGVLTKVGLKTFVDPRNSRGALNARSTDTLAELMEIGGEEYLFYKSPKVDVAIIRGTTVDVNGNVSFEHEAFYLDPYSTAMAAKANGGKVIVQVERVSATASHPRSVKLPAAIIDAIVVDGEQMQTMIEKYEPAYTGEFIMPEADIAKKHETIAHLTSGSGKKPRELLHKVIARRAAMELADGAVVNLGIGVPELVPGQAKEIGMSTNMYLTIEAGLIGGTPVGGLSFGAVLNPEMCQDTASQFDLYDSGMLDITFVGAMQVDGSGNVNVSRAGDKIIGVGGFVNLTASAKKAVFCFPFSGGGLKTEIGNGKLTIHQEGIYPKFVASVDEISASGDFRAEQGTVTIYVTERCVFERTRDGMVLTEIAPGVDMQRDILDQLPFSPIISPVLKEMDARFFNEDVA
ncbi:3-oxoacid CoA-transferase [Enterovibrio sp. ZSDZ35]|uniref:Acetate CoA-transferase YdiF n=1 Tax=Enterovibrio qingdaonensis TaxID=2899818 RepID=A0ABT5QNP1_9GAMM|nr:CoA-transferase [Enterovibrio sp. ZSDZ35]MDD1782607.1 3-oxoacid CoA-transferase [Enterovibrio sp. ZSDZ35]